MSVSKIDWNDSGQRRGFPVSPSIQTPLVDPVAMRLLRFWHSTVYVNVTLAPVDDAQLHVMDSSSVKNAGLRYLMVASAMTI